MKFYRETVFKKKNLSVEVAKWEKYTGTKV